VIFLRGKFFLIPSSSDIPKKADKSPDSSLRELIIKPAIVTLGSREGSA